MEWQIAKKIHPSLELLLRIAVAGQVEKIPVSQLPWLVLYGGMHKDGVL